MVAVSGFSIASMHTHENAKRTGSGSSVMHELWEEIMFSERPITAFVVLTKLGLLKTLRKKKPRALFSPKFHLHWKWKMMKWKFSFNVVMPNNNAQNWKPNNTQDLPTSRDGLIFLATGNNLSESEAMTKYLWWWGFVVDDIDRISRNVTSPENF